MPKQIISKFLHYYDEVTEKIIDQSTPKIFAAFDNDYPILIIEKLLTSAQCDDLVKNFLINGPSGTSKVYRGGHDKVDENIRNSLVLQIDNSDTILLKQVTLGILPEIENYFNVKFISNEGFHALGYPPGSRFAFHCDNSGFKTDPVSGLKKWKISQPERTLSSVLFLTDCVDKITDFNQCTGGELVFGLMLDKDDKAFAIRPRKGLFIAFPSNAYFSHEVEPVIDGYRVSIVDWYNCEILKP
jgi:SM-20-related protein